jgi:hypothetical protein
MKFLLGLTISQLKGRGPVHCLGGGALQSGIIVEGSWLKRRGHVIYRRLMNSTWWLLSEPFDHGWEPQRVGGWQVLSLVVGNLSVVVVLFITLLCCLLLMARYLLMKRGNHELLVVFYRLLLLRRVLKRIGDISETCCVLWGESALTNLLDDLKRTPGAIESCSLNSAHFCAHWKLVIRCM